MLKKYIWQTILPYFLLAWILLTAILFLQQGSRFAEILLSAQIPFGLLLELSAALLLTVIAFTGPMALLTGVVVGLGQMRGDSELIAFYAAGVSRLKIILPCLMLGVAISLMALAINLSGVPFAARLIRRVAVKAALLKLESPIEPGVFSTEFGKYVIYVKEGNNERGVWEKVFIHFPEKEAVKLITARTGKIDAAQDKSELVLDDAVVTTLPEKIENQSVTVEKVNNLRIALETGRKQLLERLETVEKAPEELGLSELAAFAETKTGKERIEAQILWHRRLALSLAPLFLSFLGAGLSLHFARGGKGWASILSLSILVAYYLIALLGEQMARAEIVPVFFGVWLSTLVVLVVGLRWSLIAENYSSQRFGFVSRLFQPAKQIQVRSSIKSRYRLSHFKTGFLGLLERDLWKNLTWYFALTNLCLLILFLIFTVFEVLRGVTNNSQGLVLLGRYLLLLSPLVLWQIAPSALMIAVLITYTIKAKQNEIAVWSAAGQSIYVLLLPSLLFAVLLGWLSWEWQERILPSTSPRQDVLRARLRGAGSVANQEGRFWLALPQGIISFVALKGSDNINVTNAAYYDFDSDNVHLINVHTAPSAVWRDASVTFLNEVKNFTWRVSSVDIKSTQEPVIIIPSADNLFNQTTTKAVYLDSETLANAVKTTESPSEERKLSVALHRKHSTLIVPLVLVLFSAPIAISLRRRRNISRSLGAAVFLWLLFIASTSFFERLGAEGFLPAAVAIWSPLILFGSIGLILLAKSKT